MPKPNTIRITLTDASGHHITVEANPRAGQRSIEEIIKEIVIVAEVGGEVDLNFQIRGPMPVTNH